MGGSTAARGEGVGRRRPLRSSTGAFIFRHGTSGERLLVV